MIPSCCRASRAARRFGGLAALVAWVAGWVALAVWIGLYTRRAAEAPRQTAITNWCAERVRYLHAEFDSNVKQVEILAGLVNQFNGFSATPGNMSYWGYSGCVDKITWEVHRAVTGFARPWVTSLWGGIIADKDRPWVEQQLDCQFRSPNGSIAPPSPWYSINFFPFKSIFGLRACLDFGAAFPAQMAQMLATGRAVSSPAVLAPNGRLGFRELGVGAERG
ncbi:unnamed protein product [Closterium sp. NIES-53]